MRILGIDLGSKRIGLAHSDPATGVALPGGILESRGLGRDVESLCQLIEEREIERVVVGLPIHMNGDRGPEAQKAEAFARALSEASGIRVDLQDERLTSREAERAAASLDAPTRGRGKRRAPGRKTKRRVDDLAATLILRTYLARLGPGAGAT